MKHPPTPCLKTNYPHRLVHSFPRPGPVLHQAAFCLLRTEQLLPLQLQSVAIQRQDSTWQWCLGGILGHRFMISCQSCGPWCWWCWWRSWRWRWGGGTHDESCTLRKADVAPESRPSQEEIHLPNHLPTILGGYIRCLGRIMSFDLSSSKT